jgi:hypothetical protein
MEREGTQNGLLASERCVIIFNIERLDPLRVVRCETDKHDKADR